MRSFVAITIGVLLLVCASFASPSVKFPKGFSVPENVKLTGDMIYHSLTHSQKTLTRGVDISRIATEPNAQFTLVGSESKRPATLVVVPEHLAPEDVSGELASNDFPLMELSLTLSTSIVEPGMSDDMKDAFYYEEVNKLNLPANVRISKMGESLSSCGVSLEENLLGSFTLNGAEFEKEAAGEVIYAAALACMTEFNDQVTVIDLRSAYFYAKVNYGKTSPQVEAVEKMIRSVLDSVSRRSMTFVLATDNNFFANQLLPEYDFVAVSPSHTASLKKSAQEKIAKPGTGIFQITLWFTIFISLTVIIISILTCGVGVDIEKDTLLYQTTALRGQPVL